MVKPRLIGLILFGVTLAVYISGLPSGITWNNTASDSGEFVAVVENFGVAHPPGYPTYTMIGKIFTSVLPVGELAYRLNVMSAVAAAGAATGLFVAGLYVMRIIAPNLSRGQLGTRLSKRRLSERVFGFDAPVLEVGPALVGAVGLAFAPLFWSQAIVTEVYALNALFLASVACLSLAWLAGVRNETKPSLAIPVGAALLTGVGLGNHLTMAALAVPLLVLMAWRVRWRATATRLAMVGALALGLTVYLYIPLAASADPPIVWSDPTTWAGFKWLVMGDIYQKYVFGVPPGQWMGRIVAWLELMMEQFYGVGLLLALLGAWRVWARDVMLGTALIAAFVVVTSYSVFYVTGDSFVFLIPSLLITGLWIGAGAHWVMANVVVTLLKPENDRLSAHRATVGLMTGVLILLIPGLVVLINYPAAGDLELDLTGDSEAVDYGKEVFENIEPNAVLMTGLTDGPIFSVWHERYVKRKDSDVSVIVYNFVQFDWYMESLRRRYPALIPEALPDRGPEILVAIIDQHLADRPVYFNFRQPYIIKNYEMEVIISRHNLMRVVRKLEG